MKTVCREARSTSEFIDAIRLRVQVFIIEQGFAPGWEPDDEDKKARQFVAIHKSRVAATARARKCKGGFKIERMAVRKDYRKKGVGKALAEHIVKAIGKESKIWLQSQVKARQFYEKCGFKASSKPYKSWGFPHVDRYYYGLVK
ncbi:TPA: GNAT family N-acetyltransferase [Candidatus Micrarchaeota archaeon]|nr:GNAT family N-acetyltransferase [Candidatus Micrarchaeota archaeon]